MKTTFKLLLFFVSFSVLSLGIAKKVLNQSNVTVQKTATVESLPTAMQSQKECKFCGSILSKREPSMKRVYRSKKDKIIAGVCGGLGNYFGVDPVLIRLGCVLSTFLGGAGLVAYIVAWIIIPIEPDEQTGL